jgi:predicted nucleic acid-binding protein
MNFVLDTSVVVKWFSKMREDELNNALKIREDYLNKKIFLLFPDLLFYELMNVLRYKP